MSCGRNSKVFPLLLICLLASMTAWSQVSTSRIEGTLVDASNAIVPNVTVKVTNENTGITYAVKPVLQAVTVFLHYHLGPTRSASVKLDLRLLPVNTTISPSALRWW